MRYLLLLLCFFLSYTVSAQQKNIVDELQVERVGQGRVAVHQDADIAALLGVVYEKGQDEQEPKVLKARGYRVQVYAGNYSRVARQEANEVADKLREEFPELPVYIFFQAPRWLCRVGDYRSIEEADAVMRHLKATGDFKEVSIVREQINIPLD